MAGEIIDIVNRFTYQVEDEDLKRAASAVQGNIDKVAQLTNTVEQLNAQLKKTAADDITTRQKLNAQIEQTNDLIQETQIELGKQYAASEKLQQATAKQIGIINELRVRYQVLARARDAAFNTVEITKYNKELALVQRQLTQAASAGVTAGRSFNSVGFTLGNIVRDAPSFAFGLQAGAIAISNNIGPAFDALTDRVRTLKAEGKPVGGLFREVGSALFGLTGVLNLAVLGFTLFADRIFEGTEEMKKAKQEAENYAKSLESIKEQARQSAAEELARLKILRAVAEDENKAMNIRLAAVKALQAIAPTTLGQLKQEAILAGNVADAYERAANAILAKARAEAASALLTASQARTLGLEVQKIRQGNNVTTAQQNRQKQLQQNQLNSIAGLSPLAPQLPLQILDYFANAPSDIRTSNQLQNAQRILDNTNKRLSEEEDFRNQLLDIVKRDITADSELFKFPKPKIGRTPRQREERIKQIDKEAKDTYEGSIRLIDRQLEQNKVLNEDLKFLNEQEIDINNKFLNQQVSLEERDKLLEEIGLKKDLVVRKLNFDALNQKIQIADAFGKPIEKAKFTQELQGAFQELQDATIKLTVKYAIRDSGGIAKDELKDVTDKLANGPDEQFKDQDALIARQNRREVFDNIISEYERLAQAIATALNSIYQAQEQAAEREIAIREKRVVDAQKIAERGNVDILREEKRALDASIKQREQAARRQAAVNSLLALSESLVAVARAASQGAGQGGYGAIATVIATLAALATGYATAKSLAADNTQGFKDGVIDLKGKGTATSDSIPARLSKGESVMTAQETKMYKPYLQAMRDGTFNPMMGYMPPTLKGGSTANNKRLEQRLDRVAEAVEGLTFNAENRIDRDGVHQMITATMRRQQRARR
jgi:hypothetical protein